MSEQQTPWTLQTMALINKLTPEIKGKAFEPDWFLLRQHLEAFEAHAAQVTRERDILAEKLRRWAFNEAGDLAGEPMVPLSELSKVTKERDDLRARVERMRALLMDIRYNVSSWSPEERDAKIEAALADSPPPAVTESTIRDLTRQVIGDPRSNL